MVLNLVGDGLGEEKERQLGRRDGSRYMRGRRGRRDLKGLEMKREQVDLIKG